MSTESDGALQELLELYKTARSTVAESYILEIQDAYDYGTDEEREEVERAAYKKLGVAYGDASQKELDNAVMKVLRGKALKEASLELMTQQYCESIIEAYNEKFKSWKFTVTYNDNGVPIFNAEENMDNMTEKEKSAKIRKKDIDKKIFEATRILVDKSKHDSNSFFEQMREDFIRYRTKDLRGFYESVTLEGLDDFHKAVIENLQGTKIDITEIDPDKVRKMSDKELDNFGANHDLIKYYKNIKKELNIKRKLRLKRSKSRFKKLIDTLNPNNASSAILASSFFSVFGPSDIQDFDMLSDEEWKKMEEAIRQYNRKMDNMFKRFCRNYVDEEGRHPFRDTKVVYIKPQWRYGVNTYKEAGQVYKEYWTEDVTQDTAGQVEDMLDTATLYLDSSIPRIKVYDEKGEHIVKRGYPQVVAAFMSDVNTGKLKFLKQNKSGKIITARDVEACALFEKMMTSYNGCIDQWIKDQKEKFTKLANDYKSRVISEIDLLKQGLYQTVENGKPVFRLPRTNEEKKWVRDTQNAIHKIEGMFSEPEFYESLFDKNMRWNVNSREKYTIEDFLDMVGNSAKTIDQAEKIVKRKALELFKKKVTYIRECTGLDLSYALPELDIDGIEIMIGDSVDNMRKSLERLSSARKNIKPKSANVILGMEGLFLKECAFNLKEREIIKKKNISLWCYQFGFKSNAQIIRKSPLRPFPIPKKLLETQYAATLYGSTAAASFFQLLVSNTPVDEVYFYKEKRTYELAGKASLSEQYEDITGNKTWIERDVIDIVKDMWKNKRTVTKEYWRKHEPDEETVRDCWEFNYKGVVFRPTDEMFENSAHDLFLVPGDITSIIYIAKIFRDMTSESKRKTQNFTYKNTHKRWEQLEYGGYRSDSPDGAPWKGLSKYGRPHGVKNHYTYQAPFGFLRLIEAQWNALVESDFDIFALGKFVSAEGFDVMTVAKDFVENLKKNSGAWANTIGTDEYDLDNFVILEEI